MDSDKWQRAKELFGSALAHEPAERTAFLAQACGGDETLRHEIESLLAAYEEAGTTAGSAAKDSLAGRRIGPYQLMHRIGEGGMAMVYLATRADDQYRKCVAIKLILPGLHSDDLLRRFRNERQTLAALDHPNIVKLLDGGESEDRLPYLVMDYVDGRPITDYCDAHRLSIAERLRLFRTVCGAISYAHQRLVIHRDLKPGNILVTADGTTKLLDFGIAKLLNPEAAATLVVTRTGQRLMTPDYASPEQVRGEPLTNSTDIYSLGVVLYELLTGNRPYRFKVQSRLEIERAVCEEEPVRPSTAVTCIHEVTTADGTSIIVTPEAVSRTREGDPKKLSSRLHGDLDAIVMMALRKESQRRYSSVYEFSEDIRRHLEGLPVKARPSTIIYRGTKFLHRHKDAAAAVGALLALVSALAIGGFLYSRRAPRLTDKDTIVLADFANSTGDAIFDDTLKTALSVALRQSPFLNVLSEDRMGTTLKMMTRPADTPLTAEVMREVCQRTGSKAYVAGSIASLGSEYVLGLKAVNCQSGDTLGQEQVTATSKEKVLNALGDAASKLRGELGESLATVQKFDVPLAQATTSSLEALKAYSLGIKAANEKGPAAGLPYNQRAIQLDPNFALGYSGVGVDYYNLSELGRASEYFTKAFQLREHTSEREKLMITAAYYRTVTGELDKVGQTYQEEIESYPRLYEGYNLSIVFAARGQYEMAAEITRQGMRIGPDVRGFFANLANYTLALQRFDETRQIIHKAQARQLDDFVMRDALYALAFLGADSAAMAEQQQWFTGNTDYENYGLALASDTEAYGGHLGKAGELTKRAVDSAIRADSKEDGAIWQAIAAQREAAFGNPAEARQTAAEALKLAPASQGTESEAALAFAMAGDSARAESLVQDLGRRFPLDTQMQSLWLPAIQAQLALDRKNPALALTTLQAASRIELGQIAFVLNISCLYPTYVRGEAYLATGQGTASAAEFQKIIDHSGIVWNCWTGALAHLGVARANALQSRTAEGADADAARVQAIAAYKDFLTLWKDADPDIPILKQAKAEYAKRVLSSTSSRRVKVPLAPK